MDLQYIKEFGEYVGFCEIDGYIYKHNNKMFAFNKDGFIEL